MINAQDKQNGLAQIAYTRGLIDQKLARKIADSHENLEVIELLFELIAGDLKQGLQNIVVMLEKMLK